MPETQMVRHANPFSAAWRPEPWALLAAGLGATACGPHGGEGIDAGLDSSLPESGVISTSDGGCRELVLVAERFYKPTHSVDAETTLTAPLRFVIPSEAPVIVGNAGNQLARFGFTVGHRNVSCTFRGGSVTPHPTSPADVDKGTKYLFQMCNDGSKAGDVASSSSFTFQISNGDDKDPADATIAVLTVNEASPCGGISDSGLDARDSAVDASVDADDATPNSDGNTQDAPSEVTDAVSENPVDVTVDGNADVNVDAASDADAAAVSVRCGDGIRDPLLEECDLGPGPTRALCSADCRVNDLLSILDPAPDGGSTPARTLGEGRHPLAVSATGSFGLVFVEPDANPLTLSLTTYTDKSVPADVSIPFTAGSTPVLMSNPVIAAIPGGKYVVAYTDFNGDGDELGVALRIVDPAGPPSGAPGHANSTTAFSQYDPDLLAIPSGIVVAWLDDSNVATGPDILFRTFSNDLVPTSGEQILANESANEGDVALAPFGTSWAAAWRAGDSGVETLKVRAGATDWSIGPYLPGPVGDRPALAELDSTHLLVVYTEGTDPEETGVANSSKLRAAVLDTAIPGTVTPFDVAPLFAGNESLSQNHPNAIRVGSRVYVAWRTVSPLGDARGEDLWLKQVGWSAGTGTADITSAEIPLPRWSQHRTGDQRRPALASSPLEREGTLVTAFDDLGKVFTSEGNGDPAVEQIPLPLLRLPGDGGL